MKNEVSSIELAYLVAELKKELVGARIEKIYQPKPTVFLFAFKKPGEVKRLLRIELPKYLYITVAKEEVPAKIPGFCGFLRKYIEGRTIIDVQQMGIERIVRMDLGSKDGTLLMFIELFGKGNIVIAEDDKNILGALEHAVFKERVVKPGAFYELPERQSYEKISLTMLGEILEKGKENISTTLAVDLGLGGLFANELCMLAGVDPKATEADKAQVEKLLVALQNILKHKPSPILAVKDDKPEEVIVFPMRMFEKYQVAPLKSISEGLDKIFLAAIQKQVKPTKDKQFKKVQTIVAIQEKNVNQLEKKSDQEQKTGEFIYENYQQVNSILLELQQLMKHHSLQEIQEKLKGHKIVKEINPKDGTVTLEF